MSIQVLNMCRIFSDSIGSMFSDILWYNSYVARNGDHVNHLELKIRLLEWQYVMKIGEIQYIRATEDCYWILIDRISLGGDRTRYSWV